MAATCNHHLGVHVTVPAYTYTCACACVRGNVCTMCGRYFVPLVAVTAVASFQLYSSRFINEDDNGDVWTGGTLLPPISNARACPSQAPRANAPISILQ